MADETDDRIVIQYPWKRGLVGGVLFSLFLFLLLSYSKDGNTTVAWIFSAPVLIASLGEKPRKLEISREGIIYWRQFGRPLRAKFGDLSAIQKAKMNRWNSGRTLFPGIELQYPNSDYLLIPLDLPNGDEVYDKIFKAWEGQRAAR